MIKCFFIDVASINSDIPRSSFKESDLEQLSDLILQTDGLLRPLILTANGVEKYKVVEGHREYYAAVKAKEKDNQKAEMVNAFVIPSQTQVLAIEQLKLLESDRSPTPAATNLVNIDQLLPTLLAAISQQIQPIVTQLAEQKQILDLLQSNNAIVNSTIAQLATKQQPSSPPQPEPNPVVAIDPQPPIIEKTEPIKTTSKTNNEINKITDSSGSIDSIDTDPLTLINTLSQAELSFRMERSGISKTIRNLVPNLIVTRDMQPNQKFEARAKIGAAKISGLGAARIKEIFDKLK